MYGHILYGGGEDSYKEAAFRLYTVRLHQADLTQHPQSCSQNVLVSLYNAQQKDMAGQIGAVTRH